MARTVPVGPSGNDPNPTFGKLGYMTITLPTGGGGVGVDSPKISMNTGVHQGQMVGFKVNANNCTNAITFNLAIKDRDGDQIYLSTDNFLRNAITVKMGLNIPLVEQEKIRIIGSGEPGATALIVKVTLYYNPDADIIAWGYR